jgi:hypothetical protein
MGDDLSDIGQQLALADAKHGLFKALAHLLRHHTVGAPIRREILLFLADFLESKRPKREVGYVSIASPPKQGELFRYLSDWPWSAAARRVDRYKKVWAERYGRRYRVHNEAVSKAAAYFNIDENTLADYIRRGRTRRGSKRGRTKCRSNPHTKTR